VDIEWGTYNMDLHLLEEMLKKASKKGSLPKVVAPVHFAGNPVDMKILDKLRGKVRGRVARAARSHRNLDNCHQTRR
jgi:dTDP-4-amino-4,6-dideoxygalactose transaminase